MKFLTITPLTAEQLPAAVDLDQRCLGGLWTLEGYRRELESPNSELLVLQPSDSPPGSTALTSGLIGLGCLWAIMEEAHITVLAIDSAYQRQGLGQALLYALLKAACQRRLEWATLEVRVSNQPAIALYRKFGFEDVGRRRKYYQDTGEDALILWRKGLQQPDFQDTLKTWQQQIEDQLRRSNWQLQLVNT